MARNSDAPEGKTIVINAHVIQGLNTWDLTIEPWDGAGLGAPYVHPVYKGTMPDAAGDGGSTTVYTGGCHCGRVGVAVASPGPLDGTYEGEMVECNCSICERNGYRWMYPPRRAVVLKASDSDLGKYAFGSHMMSKTFCRVCGVNVTNDRGPRAVEGDWSAENHPVNMRVLRGVDFGALPEVQRGDGWVKLPPPYENP